MKTIKYFLVMAILGLCTGYASSIPCERTVDKNLCDGYDVDTYWRPAFETNPRTWCIVCVCDEEECLTCPSCPEVGAPEYDPTDITAMEYLFDQADNEVFVEGNYNGSIGVYYQVIGEQEPRYYLVTWTLNLQDKVVMLFDRVE